MENQHRLTKSTGVRIVRPGYTLTHETGTLIESPFERLFRGYGKVDPNTINPETLGSMNWRDLLGNQQPQQLKQFEDLLEELKKASRDRVRAAQLEKMLGL